MQVTIFEGCTIRTSSERETCQQDQGSVYRKRKIDVDEGGEPISITRAYFISSMILNILLYSRPGEREVTTKVERGATAERTEEKMKHVLKYVEGTRMVFRD